MRNIRLEIREKIKELRKKRGITQQRLSELTDIDYKYIQKIEGKNPPNIKIETIAKLAKTLAVDPSKLLP